MSQFAFRGELHHVSFICFVSGEGLSASRHSLRTGLSASNLSLRGESPFSLLLSHLLPSSRAGSPAGSRCTTPAPTPQNSPPSSPGVSRGASRSSQQSQPQAPELLVSPASDGIPTVVIHPPEEDLAALEGQEQQAEDNVGMTPGNYSSPPCVAPLPLPLLHVECLSARSFSSICTSCLQLTVTCACLFSLWRIVEENRILQ